jgi:AcrR family transcriptional regulator
MGAPRTARERARVEITAEIKAVARRHLNEQGAVALSLRAVARELGMASSAVYRYFPSRDELLTALIIDSYEAVGAAAEAALPPVGRGVVDRWRAIAAAIRAWALANPQEYALIYGSPVPGYHAPVDTVDPAARVALVFLGILRDGAAAGELTGADEPDVPRLLAADFAALADEVMPGVPQSVVARGLGVWTQLFGAISFELFGHLHNVIHDHDGLFELEMSRAGQRLVSGP